MKRIDSYQRFCESQAEQMISECALFLLPELEEALMSIYNAGFRSGDANSEIAYELLRKRGVETGKDIAFADLEGDKIAFSTERSADKAFPGALAFASKHGRIGSETAGIISRSGGRAMMNIGKFVRAIAGKEISDKDLEGFVNALKAKSAAKQGYEIDVFDGEDIKRMYSEEAMANCPGSTLYQSCMKDKHKAVPNVFDIYVKNPESCKLVAMLDREGKLSARALLWRVQGMAPGMPKEFWFVDRIYAAADWMTKKIQEWAIAKGYAVRKNNIGGRVTLDGQEYRCEMRAAVKKIAYRGFPYMDTFSHYDVKNGWLYSYDAPGFEGFGLQSTLGSYGTTTGHGPVFRNYIRRFAK